MKHRTEKMPRVKAMKMHGVVALASVLTLAGMSYAADPPVVVDPAEQVSEVPPLPHTPAPVNGLLYARPFTLEEGYEFEWRAERPVVSAGWLLVLNVNSDLVFPRQTAEPVLFVGQTTAERINLGHESGRVIVIVPSELNEQGEMALALETALMWFGAPALPEQIDAAKIEAQRRSALAQGLAPMAAGVIAQARAKGGASLQVANRAELNAAAAELIKVHSPQETELAELLIEQAKAAPQQPNGE